MNNNNNNKSIYLVIFLISLTFTISFSSLSIMPQFVNANGQVDPSQEQMEPIPPSNNTNNQTGPIVISK
ncbi:MAG TPA: hypothetical protein VFV86_03790 [Nitrososphaeraceae archaeon]|nr:hypothetical protein [Nitrososphaeraceae archaeon]